MKHKPADSSDALSRFSLFVISFSPYSFSPQLEVHTNIDEE